MKILNKIINWFRKPSQYLQDKKCVNCGLATIIKFKNRCSFIDHDGSCISCGCDWFEIKQKFSSSDLDHIAVLLEQKTNNFLFSKEFPFPKELQTFSTFNVPTFKDLSIYTNPEKIKTSVKESQLKLIESKHKSKADPMKITDSAPTNILPEDYTECQECGYDHKYDTTLALVKHNEILSVIKK